MKRYKWKIFLNVFYVMLLLFFTFSFLPVQAEELPEEKIATETIATEEEGSIGEAAPVGVSQIKVDVVVETTEEILTYTDALGNVFNYKLNDDGTITIIGITVSGDILTIPENIEERQVFVVENESNCVVSNPEVSIAELTINCPVLGANAFRGLTIDGTLTIGEEVSIFKESDDSQKDYHYWNQFKDCKIKHLFYAAEEARVVNDVIEIDKEGSNYSGPFSGAIIDAFTLGRNVKIIPNFLLMNSNVQIEELELYMSEIGSMAFESSGVSIGKLILGEEVTSLKNSGTIMRFWGQFARATISEVYYNALSLELEEEPESNNYYCEGPFYLSKIGKLYLSDKVERYPGHCFQNAYIEQEELEIHAKSIGIKAFAGNNIAIGTLIIGEEVKNFEKLEIESVIYYGQFEKCSIDKLICQATKSETEILNTRYGVFYKAEITDVYTHHNSDFNKFFSNENIECNYLCANYFETTYGNKFYDEETKKYLLEIFYICSICDYEENDTKVLDKSYQFGISRPVAIALTYNRDKKIYTGKGNVTMYGSLGDYYDGVHATIDKDENYGKAVMNENTYDISDFLTVELISNDTLTYSEVALAEDEFFLAWDLIIEVDALAFIESGAGTYTFYIPVGWELEY